MLSASLNKTGTGVTVWNSALYNLHRLLFGLLNSISLCSSTILYFSADRPNCTKFPSLKCAHISLWLNPTGYSKFHNTSNHPPPATDSSWTVRTPLYPPVQSVPPYSLPLCFPVPDRGTSEGRYLFP